MQANGVALQWDDALWTDALRGRGLHIPSLSIRSLRVDDQRPPAPSEPLADLSLPLPLSLGFSLERFELTGRQTLSAADIAGHYRYTRYDRDDLRSALRSRGVALTTSSHVYDEPCAQHLLTMMMSLARQLPYAQDDQRGPRTWPSAPRWVGTPLYILLGWVAAWFIGPILQGAGVAAVVLLIVGGALYSIGGVLYALKWPNPWPTTFGHHEFFHACTLVAATCHHIAIYFALYA